MPGRTLTRPGTAAIPLRRRPLLGYLLAALTLLALGIAIGSHIAAPLAPSAPAAPVHAHSGPARSPSAAARRPGSLPASVSATTAQTRAGAAAAAAEATTAFDGSVLLDPRRLRRVVERIAAPSARASLTATFLAASEQTRAKLGVDTIPRPVVILRSVPVGYRFLAYTPKSARVAVWYLGIVGSGATIPLQQSWRTETVTLQWWQGGWKVTSFQSTTGPTPPLAAADTEAAAPGQLFTVIPRFREFAHARP